MKRHFGTTEEISVADVNSVLRYESESGEFIWLKYSSRGAIGTKAGNVCRHLGYRRIQIRGRSYYAHRLAFLLMTGRWPVGEIDHLDLDRSNNKWENLRECSHSQNGQNCRPRRTNKSGFKGVSFDRRRNKWRACISVGGKSLSLGMFYDKADAAAAYDIAAIEHFGANARLSEAGDAA